MSPGGPRYLSAALSDQGPVRGNNEDRVYTDDARGVFLVVDGMGGHEAGEQAAAQAVDTIKARLERQTGTVEQRIREAITLANNAIFEAAQSRIEWRGMACVLTLAVVDDGWVTVGHVGDSRLYTLRRGHLDKVTHDHSPVGEREDNGEISEAEAMKHPRRNEVFRDVGSEERTPDEEGFIEVQRIPFAKDSALLLCSDGLSDAIPSSRILELVERNAGDPAKAVRALISAATVVGKDNVSAVLVEGEAFAASFGKHPAKPRPPAPAPTDYIPGDSTIRLGRLPWYRGRTVFFLLGGIAGAVFAYFAAQYFWLQNQPRSPRRIVVAAPGTITEAVASAQAGDTVVVAPGAYSEAIRLKSGVNLISQEAHQAIVHGPITADDVQNARLEGFQVEGPNTGIRITNSDVALSRDDVSGAHATGVEFSGNSRGVILACNIHDNLGPGILISGGASPVIERNLIARNGKRPDALRPGLFVTSSLEPFVDGNSFEANGAEAIWLAAPDKSILLRNHFPDSPEDAKKPRLRIVGTGENQP